MSADLPPQAYDTQTLQEAFDWLQTQDDVVRASVHTPERLVSLFKRAQRLNDQDHPVSSKKFISDLKSLATSLDQFSGTPQQFTVPTPAPALKMEPMQTPTQRPPSQAETVASPPPPPIQETTTETVQKASFELTTNTRRTTSHGGLNLDATTEARIREVQKRFNLSSEQETLRLLVSLGYEKFNEIP